MDQLTPSDQEPSGDTIPDQEEDIPLNPVPSQPQAQSSQPTMEDQQVVRYSWKHSTHLFC